MFHLKNFLANLRILRSILIPILKTLNFEFRWKHDLTNKPFYLQSYYHKGYWFYGQNREKNELYFFGKKLSELNPPCAPTSSPTIFLFFNNPCNKLKKLYLLLL